MHDSTPICSNSTDKNTPEIPAFEFASVKRSEAILRAIKLARLSEMVRHEG